MKEAKVTKAMMKCWQPSKGSMIVKKEFQFWEFWKYHRRGRSSKVWCKNKFPLSKWDFNFNCIVLVVWDKTPESIGMLQNLCFGAFPSSGMSHICALVLSYLCICAFVLRNQLNSRATVASRERVIIGIIAGRPLSAIFGHFRHFLPFLTIFFRNRTTMLRK